LATREVDDAKKEIDAMYLYIRHGIRIPGIPEIVCAVLRGWDGRRVFLQDGDALVYPYSKLISALEHLNQKFPGIERIGSYATPQDILRRSEDELRALKELKLGILYMGVESGDNRVLEKIGKGVNHKQLVEAGHKARQAGILLSVTIILGLGGVQGSLQHAMETARVLTEIDPDYVGALTLTLVPGTPLHEQWKRGEFDLISPFEFITELRIIVENADFTSCFFSSMHASNYLSIRGTLPGDRSRMLSQLEDVLERGDPSILRPEFLRGL